MMTKSFYSRIALMVLACLTAMTASASSYLYIDYPDITREDMGTQITIPVKASFDNYVSSWDVQFHYPPGITPVRLIAGNDIKIPFVDPYGQVTTHQAEMMKSNDLTHVVCNSFFAPQWYDPEEDEYYYEDYILKWEAGEYDEMMFLTVSVNEDFAGGKIGLNSTTVCGYDPRNESSTLTPMEGNPPLEASDVNYDGNISIADVTTLMNLILGHETPYNAESGDINGDGILDIVDVNCLTDYLFTMTAYEGYAPDKHRSMYDLTRPTWSHCYLYIDDLEITEADYMREITVPVKAVFEDEVSCWDMELILPEGLTPIRVTKGNDMKNLTYTHEDGEVLPAYMNLVYNDELTHFLGFTFDYNCKPAQDEGQDEYYNVRWNPGEYDEMFLLTLRVDEPYNAVGDIVAKTNASASYNPYRPDDFLPFSLEISHEWGWWHDDWFYGTDANWDGQCNVSDITCIADWIVNDYPNSDDPYYQQYSIGGDYCRDGVVNVVDIAMIIDYLLSFDNGLYEGYTLYQEEIVSQSTLQEPVIGDLSGDGKLTISDVTAMVNLLLTNNGFYDFIADVNGDGKVNISDVTALINILLTTP